ncbi:ATP-binding protein [Companilactobacillus muriivasis]|uniref:ATP-binding protein n=1 Tax=Companilactobacillus muriivasis TaxID=3081444 RepID=UPI0030C75968
MNNNDEKSMKVAIVTEIKGTYIKARMLENTNSLTYYYSGSIYRGVGIGEYIGIRRGSYKLIGKVTREYVEDTNNDVEDQEFNIRRFIRDIDINIVGAIRDGKFEFGIAIFPQIFSEIEMLTSDEISLIIGGGVKQTKYPLKVGKTIPEKIDYSIDWSNFFNKHFAIFGNTGSGKSNTLTKIYTELFNLKEREGLQLEKSRFVVMDFNGEYTGDKVFLKNKTVIRLNTRALRTRNSNKIQLPKKEFWDVEMLSVLFSATEQTQEPFLRSVINFYRPDEENISADKIKSFIVTAFKQTFYTTNLSEKTLPLLKKALNILKIGPKAESEVFYWLNAKWNTTNKFYFTDVDPMVPSAYRIKGYGNRIFLGNGIDESRFINIVENGLDNIKDANEYSPLKLLSAFVDFQMIFQLNYNIDQFDFISPLLNRIDSKASMFDKLITVSDSDNLSGMCSVISMKDINKDARTMIPLLVSRYLYRRQKATVKEGENFKGTTHLIIDEAHNILSRNSSRESDKWRDYRLDVFEEIVKEGRKFGFYLTVSSQRPSDISQTIVSQMHNFLIHRLVNENDLNMLSNSLNTLDSVSKAAIPSLAPGMAIFTGVSFDMPVTVMIDKLPKVNSPHSENANLEELWLPDSSESNEAEKV